jgi:hypothetical protein
MPPRQPNAARSILAVCILVLVVCLPQSPALAKVSQVSPAPSGEPFSSRFTVQADGADVPVYTARVVSLTPEQREKVRGTVSLSDTTDAAFASLDISGLVQVVVTCRERVDSAKILPKSLGIQPATVIDHHQIVIILRAPAQLTVEINGDWLNSLHLFANPVQTDTPRPGDPNVIYFAPGIHEIQNIQVGSNQTVYVAAGAVLYGKPDSKNHSALINLSGSNITLRGRGIIDGSRMPRGTGGLLLAQGSNISIEGVTLRDSASWTCHLAGSDHVQIQNVKVFGWRGNSDGIDLCNSRDVTVSDCFLRTFDDLVVVKTNDEKAGPASDISVKRCVLWNEFAHALSLGAELRAPLENIVFTDCDIIHDKGREWDLRVYNCDSAPVRNVVFDNIRIEESRRLFSLWIGKAVWSKEPDRGHIDDITFSNITSVAPTRPGSAPAELVGFDDQHAIHDVQFRDVLIGDQPMTMNQVKQNAFVQGVVINAAPASGPPGLDNRRQ